MIAKAHDGSTRIVDICLRFWYNGGKQQHILLLSIYVSNLIQAVARQPALPTCHQDFSFSYIQKKLC